MPVHMHTNTRMLVLYLSILWMFLHLQAHISDAPSTTDEARACLPAKVWGQF